MRLTAASFLLPAIIATIVRAQEPANTFRVDVRLVEIYATVFDHRGRYLSGLTRDHFEVLDNGKPQPIVAFESDSSMLSCAILFDATGSMAEALPVVKNAIVKLIDELRESDSVAIYTFSTSLRAAQEFTQDKNAAKRAVLRTRAAGGTALFDAIALLARETSGRKGKKAIIVFTDGQDNASSLHADAAATRARKVGIPVYAVAQGQALKSKALVEQLHELSQRTGGVAYIARKVRDIEKIFTDISSDLQHTYMVAYKAPPVEEPRWRTIRLAVKIPQRHKVRAKEGYLPE